jgi:hypothetical protein
VSRKPRAVRQSPDFSPRDMNRRTPRALDRILALGEKASRYSEAALARKVGVSRERIRQLKAQLPHKPANRLAGEIGSCDGPEGAFYTAMRRGIDRLVALVDVRGDDECWPWLGHRSRGYGVLRPGHRSVHRLIYEREHGPIPKGMLVVHKLAGRPCCNPRHLVLATGRERAWRACLDGAQVRISDELRRLTPAKVLAIRRAYAKLPKVKVRRRGRTIVQAPFGCTKALAERFGIKDRRLVVNIATGKSGSWILSKNQGGIRGAVNDHWHG